MKTALVLLGGFVLSFLLSACSGTVSGGGAGAGGALGSGGASAGGDACHLMAGLACSPDAAAEVDACAAAYGAGHPVPSVCEDVTPEGNCRSLEQFTTCGELVGRVWCCGEDTAATCAPFDDVACDGPGAVALVGRCVERFGEAFGELVTCGQEDGPAHCKSLSAFSPGLVVDCGGGADRFVWCCAGE